MKAVSLSLKIVAILAAAFCVYSWIDVRGKISAAEAHMKQVSGATLAEKAPNVPALFKQIADLKKSMENAQGIIRKREADINSVNSELESERRKSVEANAEIVKNRATIRSLEANVASSKKKIAEKDTLIETLKREIVSTKSMLAQNNETDSLKEKISTLESQLEAKTQALEEAEKKIKTLQASEVMELVETDAMGNKVVRKVIKTPYIPKGDIATVVSLKKSEGMLLINKGEKAGVKADQKIQLKREGVLVTEIVIIDAKEDFSIAYFNPNVGIPETIETGDLLEMTTPAVETPQEAPAESSDNVTTEGASNEA